MEPFSYTNRYGVTYYPCRVRGRNGGTYWVMHTRLKGAATKLPGGYEVRENVHGNVCLRRTRPRRIAELEERMLRAAMEQLRPFAYALDVEGPAATVYASADDRKCFQESLDAEFAEGFAEALSGALAKRYSPELVEMFRARRQAKVRRMQYYPLLRFVLVDKRQRRFAVERVCFSGESNWVRLEVMTLTAAAMKYLPHLGRESFFALI